MKKYIAIKELSEYLSVKPSTIYHWTHTEFIPHYKIGGHVRFNLEEVEEREKCSEIKTQEDSIRNMPR